MSRTTSDIIKVRNPNGGDVLTWDPDKREWTAAPIPSGAGGAAGSPAGALITDNTPGVGAVTGYSPSGFGSTTGRLDIVADDAGTTINDLPIGFDGQRVRIRNKGLVGTLTLTNANAGSAAATRFAGAGDAGIVPGDSLDIVYYSSDQRWSM